MAMPVEAKPVGCTVPFVSDNPLEPTVEL